jgi:hypothetical protein
VGAEATTGGSQAHAQSENGRELVLHCCTAARLHWGSGPRAGALVICVKKAQSTKQSTATQGASLVLVARRRLVSVSCASRCHGSAALYCPLLVAGWLDHARPVARGLGPMAAGSLGPVPELQPSRRASTHYPPSHLLSTHHPSPIAHPQPPNITSANAP